MYFSKYSTGCGNQTLKRRFLTPYASYFKKDLNLQSLNLKVLNLKTNKNNYIIYEQEESLSAEYEAPKCKAIKQHQNDNNNSGDPKTKFLRLFFSALRPPPIPPPKKNFS